MAAVICILGPVSLPIGPVPVSLTNFAVFLAVYVLGTEAGCMSVVIYLLLGLAGLPVFSGFSGGPAKLMGPTGGYIIGFIPMAILSGIVIDRFWNKRIICILAMEASTWVLYLLGTTWLSYQMKLPFKEALAVGVLPFIIVDLIKIVAVSVIGPEIKKRIPF
ncbi:MAG TPA: biotin transporter BioY [Lachnospiraceae bacterium]|nr:biotin transporter BioY [Lachnospiraceae bacterium]